MTTVPMFAYGMSAGELAEACRSFGQPVYRARQLWDWLYVRRAESWDAMTNLPAELRRRLAGQFRLDAVTLREVAGSAADTRKLLLGLHDGESIETVVIPAARRTTLCLSSQVGCRYRCAFCASGQSGFTRDLARGEIVGQFMAGWTVNGDKPTHVVMMGVGEPLDNYGNVMSAVRILNDGAGLNIGARRITISTSGVVPGIEQLAGEQLQVELSVSLHAPTDALRDTLMPVNRRYPLSALLEACRAYTAATNRIITFEYTLMRGLNDSPEQARRLAGLLAPLRCRVNLIALSPVREFDGQPSARETCERFAQLLTAGGINTTFRASRGRNVDAACGQLRASRRAGE